MKVHEDKQEAEEENVFLRHGLKPCWLGSHSSCWFLQNVSHVLHVFHIHFLFSVLSAAQRAQAERRSSCMLRHLGEGGGGVISDRAGNLRLSVTSHSSCLNILNTHTACSASQTCLTPPPFLLVAGVLSSSSSFLNTSGFAMQTDSRTGEENTEPTAAVRKQMDSAAVPTAFTDDRSTPEQKPKLQMEEKTPLPLRFSSPDMVITVG